MLIEKGGVFGEDKQGDKARNLGVFFIGKDCIIPALQWKRDEEYTKIAMLSVGFTPRLGQERSWVISPREAGRLITF